jgi:hypothetical protein
MPSQRPIIPSDLALADQLAAATAENIATDMSPFLQPEGVARRDTVTLATAHVGPITSAFVAWLQGGSKLFGCMASRTPQPLFAIIERPTVFCAGCFGDVAAAYARASDGVCSVCKYATDDRAPVSAKVGMFNVLLFACPDCMLREHKASLRERFSRIAGKSSPCEGDE